MTSVIFFQFKFFSVVTSWNLFFFFLLFQKKSASGEPEPAAPALAEPTPAAPAPAVDDTLSDVSGDLNDSALDSAFDEDDDLLDPIAETQVCLHAIPSIRNHSFSSSPVQRCFCSKFTVKGLVFELFSTLFHWINAIFTFNRVIIAKNRNEHVITWLTKLMF